MNLKLIFIIILIIISTACTSGRKKSNNQINSIINEPSSSILKKDSKSITETSKTSIDFSNNDVLVYQDLLNWCDLNQKICFRDERIIMGIIGFNQYRIGKSDSNSNQVLEFYLNQKYTYNFELKIIYNASTNLPLYFWDYEKPETPIAYDPNNIELQNKMPIVSVTNKTHTAQSHSIQDLNNIRTVQTTHILNKPQIMSRSILK